MSNVWSCMSLSALFFTFPTFLGALEETLPPGVEQILPRGGIPAVFEPVFVDAEDAEISDGAWVLGVVIDGQARAYSLNLLNRHEVVNDRIGEKSFAAVW